jgi:hypothetical protein
VARAALASCTDAQLCGHLFLHADLCGAALGLFVEFCVPSRPHNWPLLGALLQLPELRAELALPEAQRRVAARVAKLKGLQPPPFS